VTTSGWRIAFGEVTIIESQTGDRRDRCAAADNARDRAPLVAVLCLPKGGRPEVHTGDGSIDVEPVSGRISLSTGDGSITTDGLKKNIRLHTNDGSIRATNLSGRLKADTKRLHERPGRFDVLDLRMGDGGIDAAAESGFKVEAAWSLRSGDGSIILRVPDNLNADLDAHTDDGSISLNMPVTVSKTIRKNAVRNPLGPDSPPLQIYTNDGSIRLTKL
jgi:hypothetical protein